MYLYFSNNFNLLIYMQYRNAESYEVNDLL
jgi:hypothetical protein